MKRFIKGLLALVVIIIVPALCTADEYSYDGPYLDDIEWNLSYHDLQFPRGRFYRFSGTCNIFYLQHYQGGTIRVRVGCSLSAGCEYNSLTGEFREKLSIHPTSVHWTPKVPKHKLVPRSYVWRNVTWYYETTGTCSSDPWLYGLDPSRLKAIQTTEGHTGLEAIPEKLRRPYIFLPSTVLFASDAINSTQRTQLLHEAMTAPKEYCDKMLKRNIISMLGPIQIVSPAPGQTFENGRVTFEFKLPCEFSFGLGKHAFVISLQRCKSGCVKEGGALIKLSGTGNSNKIEEFWEPVAIPFMENNTMKMWLNTAPQIFESEASRNVEIPYEGEGQKFRFKVEARLWDGNKFITVPGPKEWHYFWVGRNLQRPDLVVSKIELRLSGSNKLEFNICVKDTGNAPVKSVGGEKLKYETEVDVVGFKNGQPYPKLTTGNYPLTVYVPHGGEGCNTLEVPRPAFETAFGLKVTVDPKNRIPEIKESNNTHRAQLLWKGDKSQLILKPKIWVLLAKTTFEWQAGSGYKVTWKGRFIKPNRYVRVFLVPQSSVGPETKVELSPPSGFPFDAGKHTVNVPFDTPPGYYLIYLEMVGVPTYNTYSDAVIHVVGSTFKRRNLSKAPPKKKITNPPQTTVNVHTKRLPKQGKKAPVIFKQLRLTSPQGMETFYIGDTRHPCKVRWQAQGIEGRVRVVLVDRYGHKKTLNGMLGTDVKQGRFDWKIGSDIKPGSMYKIFVETTDAKARSNKSGGFNVRLLKSGAVSKPFKKKSEPKLEAKPKSSIIHLDK